MAGQWIKFDVDTLDKPEVFRIARALNVDRDLIVGKLLRLWAWFDTNSVDGRVDGVVDADVDALVDAVGFCNALKCVSWYESDAELETATLPNFGRHNGETAKKRAEKSARQAKWRNGTQNVDADVDGRVVHLASTSASTREEKEKRREEKKNRAKRSVPEDFAITDEMRRWADEHVPTVDIDVATPQFVDDRRSKSVTYTDPVLGWRTWMRNCVQYGKPLKSVRDSRQREML